MFNSPANRRWDPSQRADSALLTQRGQSLSHPALARSRFADGERFPTGQPEQELAQ